jgi:hypothetical protein
MPCHGRSSRTLFLFRDHSSRFGRCAVRPIIRRRLGSGLLVSCALPQIGAAICMCWLGSISSTLYVSAAAVPHRAQGLSLLDLRDRQLDAMNGNNFWMKSGIDCSLAKNCIQATKERRGGYRTNACRICAIRDQCTTETKFSFS